MSTVTSSTLAPSAKFVKSIRGRKLGQEDNQGALVSNGSLITNRAVNASIAVADESVDVRAVTITLRDALGNAIDYKEIFEIFVFSTTGRTALATGGSTGLAIGANGLILKTVTAKLYFVCQTDANGVLTLTWTDSGTESVAIVVRLPNGNTITSAAFANA
jgi:hypothetical protein